MSFEEIWNENKGFILSLGAGFIVFLTGYFIISSSFESEIKSNESAVRRYQSRIRSQKLPPGRKQAVERALEELNEQMAALETELAYRPAAGFSLKGITKAPDIHFNEIVQKMLAGVVELAARDDIRLASDLGLGSVTPRSNVEREWYLNGLDVVNRICLSAIAAGVSSVEPIRIARMPKKKKQRQNRNPYAREISVSFNAMGDPGAVDQFMRGLLLPGAQFAVEKASIVSLDDPGVKKRAVGLEHYVRLDMTVKALLVDSEGEPERFRGKRF